MGKNKEELREAKLGKNKADRFMQMDGKGKEWIRNIKIKATFFIQVKLHMPEIFQGGNSRSQEGFLEEVLRQEYFFCIIYDCFNG